MYLTTITNHTVFMLHLSHHFNFSIHNTTKIWETFFMWILGLLWGTQFLEIYSCTLEAYLHTSNSRLRTTHNQHFNMYICTLKQNFKHTHTISTQKLNFVFISHTNIENILSFITYNNNFLSFMFTKKCIWVQVKLLNCSNKYI